MEKSKKTVVVALNRRIESTTMSQQNDGFSPEEMFLLDEVAKGHFWHESKNKLIIYLITRYFPEFSSFLEIGCANGFVLSAIHEAFPYRKLVGSELFSEGLARARRRLPNIDLHLLDARQLNFENEFDLIGAFDVLEHIKEDIKVLHNIHTALKPGGGVIITVPQHQWLWSAHDESLYHVRRYSNSDLKTKLQDSGFTIIRSLSFVATLLPVLILSRLAYNLKKKSHGESYEQRVPSWLNTILSHVLSFERELIKLGVNFPCGGSRVVVARRD
jgi:SAM-dependent methyltransferase